MFVPYVVIKLLSFLGRGFGCCKFVVCYYLYCLGDGSAVAVCLLFVIASNA